MEGKSHLTFVLATALVKGQAQTGLQGTCCQVSVIQLPSPFLLGGRLQRATTFGGSQKGKIFMGGL